MTVYVKTSANSVLGTAGNDIILVAAPADALTGTINGAGGSGDELRFTSTTAQTLVIDVNMTNVESVVIGTGSAATAVTTGITNESVDASGAVNALTLIGNNGANTLTGTAFSDILTGNGGSDLLRGGAGNDVLDGGAGNDVLQGGAGDDTYIVDSGGDVVDETSATGGTDLVQSGVTAILAANLENLTLTGSADLNGTGNGLANVITGNAGSNLLTGAGGNDVLYGGAGNDTLTGGGGLDTTYGGAGNDIHVVDGNTDAVVENAAEGTDTLQVAYSNATTPVTLDLAAYPNFENIIVTGSGLYNLLGDASDNALTGNGSVNILTGNDGNDVLSGGAGIDTLDGGLGNDTLDGGSGNDILTGGDGDDTYVLDSTGDTFDDSGGIDTLIIDYDVSATVLVELGSGLYAEIENVTVTGSGKFDLTGDAGDNVLTGNNSVNLMYGGDGNDVLTGGGGVDTMYGGDGNDTYVVDSGADEINESAGMGTADLLKIGVSATLTGDYAEIENLTLLGTGNFYATGNAVANILTGNSGSNTLDGLAGADTMDGMGGNDTYKVNEAGDVVSESGVGAAGGTDLVQSEVTFTLDANLENLTLILNGNIDGTGNTANNVITGNTGNNLLTGGGGNDTLIGGAGDDTYIVDSAGDTVSETLTAAGGTDTVQSAIGYALGANVENLTLTGGGHFSATGNGLINIITGNSGNNLLNGGGAADTLIGGDGNDTYVIDAGDIVNEAGTGTDTVQVGYNVTVLTIIDLNSTYTNIENVIVTGTGLFNLTGNASDNVLTGNASVNTLTGGDGNDVLTGGGGADILIGGLGNDTYVVDSGIDVITENAGEGTADLLKIGVTAALSGPYADIEDLTLLGTGAINATGNAAANALTGNSGNNVLDGLGGADTMDGMGGNDTYKVDDLLDAVSESLAAGGTDLVQSGVSFTLDANVENLTLTGAVDINSGGTGNVLANIILGTSGDNRLDGGAGNDKLTGFAGNDTFVVDSTGDKLTEAANQGADTVESSITWTLATNFENLALTGAGNINGTGNAVANVITGNSGNNVLSGGAGDDTMAGGDGDDTYVLSSAAELLLVTENAGEGSDTLKITYNLGVTPPIVLTGALAEFENVTVTGTGAFALTGNAEDNVLTGNASANVLIGGGGNDTLIGGGGADTMTGGSGDDTYGVDAAGDIIVTDTGGIDTVLAGFTYSIALDLDNITLLGTGAINATGNAGANVLTGNSGANKLNGLGGADTMDGMGGNDTYVVDDALDVTDESISGTAGGIDLVQSTALACTLGANVENLTLMSGAIDGTGNLLANTITGNSAANRLDGGAGNDRLNGGAGNDTYVVDNAGDVITDTGGAADTVESGITWTLGTTLENLALTGAGNINGTGNALPNTITGNTGNNVLSGGAGIDTLTGGDGNDTLDGGAGDDTMAGGDGDDTYVLSSAAELPLVTENASEGSDTLRITYNLGVTPPIVLTGALAEFENVTVTGTGAFALTGNAADNVLTGNASANVLIGGGGNDTLIGGGGADNMTGGGGDDTYGVDTILDTITDTGGTDTVLSSITWTIAGAPVLDNITLLGTGAINATGNAGANVLTGNSGANLLDGLGGADTMDGMGGNDTYVVDDAGDAVAESISGTAGGTDYVQSTISFTLDANLENLTLLELGNAIDGTGNALANQITGNNAANVIDGGAGNDILTGNGGDDTLAGGTGNDVLNGGAGDDSLDGGGGNDAMTGGAGNDTYVVDSTTDTITESANQGIDTVEAGITWTLGATLDNLVLTGSGNINGAGNTLGNMLTGNGGNNVLSGGAGVDALDGGDGNDILDGGAGSDSLSGGLGNDTLIVDSASDTAVENAGEGTDTLQVMYTAAGGGTTLDLSGALAEIENVVVLGTGVFNLTGNAYDNRLTGNASNNVLLGNDGDDTLDGGAGGDTLDGGAGNDSLNGGAGNDTYVVDSVDDVVIETQAGGAGGTDLVQSGVDYTLGANLENLTLLDAGGDIDGAGNTANNVITGNTGANELNGGLGLDTLTGNAGNDVFIFDTAPAAANVDTITDFVSGTDTLEFDNEVFTGIGPDGPLDIDAFISGNGTTTAQDAEDRLIYNTATGRLYYDADGNSLGGVAAIQVATLTNLPALDWTDINVV